MACLTVQPQLASTRISLSVALADRAQDLDVAVGAELDLEDRILRGLAHLEPGSAPGVSSPMVKVDRGALAGIESPEPVERNAEPLADQIVERALKRRAGGGVDPEQRLPAALGFLEIRTGRPAGRSA